MTRPGLRPTLSEAMRSAARALLPTACLLLSAGACILAPVKRVRLFPSIPEGAVERRRLPDGWTVSVQGALASGKMTLLRAGGRLAAAIEVVNEASEEPLRLKGVVAYDKEKVVLPREQARLGESLAAVIVSDLYKERAEAPRQAEFLQASVFGDDPIPKGLSKRGTALFVLTDQKPPFTLELELAAGARTEKLSFVFKEFGPAEFWDNPEMSLQDPLYYFHNLTFEERQDAFETARRARLDRAGYARMKKEDPRRWQLYDWVRIHEYDIEF